MIMIWLFWGQQETLAQSLRLSGSYVSMLIVLYDVLILGNTS